MLKKMLLIIYVSIVCVSATELSNYERGFAIGAGASAGAIIKQNFYGLNLSEYTTKCTELLMNDKFANRSTVHFRIAVDECIKISQAK